VAAFPVFAPLTACTSQAGGRISNFYSAIGSVAVKVVDAYFLGKSKDDIRKDAEWLLTEIPWDDYSLYYVFFFTSVERVVDKEGNETFINKKVRDTRCLPALCTAHLLPRVYSKTTFLFKPSPSCASRRRMPQMSWARIRMPTSHPRTLRVPTAPSSWQSKLYVLPGLGFVPR
jgi:hypothetical protein